ncbi:MAG TPA: TIGR02452 family protein [Candidatus Cloacimonadota bacterium]|nr:TIGR02452 family protein [Candidatus Cloacimonadota bacterium]
MPNVGIHHCATCHFYQNGGCVIRDIDIDKAQRTGCQNWNGTDKTPVGPVYSIVEVATKGGLSYALVPYYYGIRVETERSRGGSGLVVSIKDKHGIRHEFPSLSAYMEFYNRSQTQAHASWDHISWLERFRARPDGPEHYRSLRREVWQSTVDIVNADRYVSANGHKVHLDADRQILSRAESVFYADTRNIHAEPRPMYDTVCYAIESDCLETCRLLQLAGFKPAVLNMANRHNPGGGVVGGSGAQEENIFRRSTAFRSLYRFASYASQYGLELDARFSYPIPRESGGIYSSGVTVFRSSENCGYYLLDVPFMIDLITVPAIANPQTVTRDGKLWIADHLVEPTKEKLRAILRIGKVHAHDALVLSAFGCGAFANPPHHVARLFREVLNEEEFEKAFRLIVFAVIDDHNAHREHNPQGNLLPFQEVFN